MPEIKRVTGRASDTIFKYIQGVEVFPEYREALRVKQGGSKERAKKKWIEAKETALNIIGDISRRDKLLFLAGLYWGEGTKSELNLINGDPYLIKFFLSGLYELGVQKKEIKINLRIFSNMDEVEITNFWIDFLELDRENFARSEILQGYEENKLVYGMCRVRVRKSAQYFKLVMSMIDLMKGKIKQSPHSSMDRIAHS